MNAASPLSFLKYFFAALLIYVLPVLILWGSYVFSAPLPNSLASNPEWLLIVFASTAIMAPLFIVFGGLAGISLGIFYYVIAYGLLIHYWRRDKAKKRFHNTSGLTLHPNHIPELEI